MISFWLTEATAQSLSRVLFENNLLQYELMQQDLSPADRSVLQTSCTSLFCFGALVPQVQQLYPNCTVNVRAYATAQPVVSMQRSQIVTHWEGIVEFYATNTAAGDDENAENFLFSINSDAYFNATVDVYGLDVTTRITDYDFTVTLNRTEIGDVNVGRVHVMLDIAMVTAVVQRLNQLGQRGVRLPMIKHVSYGQPLMTLYDECVFVGENVTYTPVLLKAKYNPT